MNREDAILELARFEREALKRIASKIAAEQRGEAFEGIDTMSKLPFNFVTLSAPVAPKAPASKALKFFRVATAVAVVACAFFYGAAANARSPDRWNNSGFSTSHSAPLRDMLQGFADQRAHDYTGFQLGAYNAFGQYGRPARSAAPAEDVGASDEAAPADWADKCSSSCLDLAK